VTAVHYSPRLIMKIIINLGREILLLGSVRESIMKPSETSSGKKMFILASSIGDQIHYANFHNTRYTKNNFVLLIALRLHYCFENFNLPGMCLSGSHLHSSNEASIIYGLMVVMMLFILSLNCSLSTDISFTNLPSPNNFLIM
jgi:hypothetical protein